MNLDLKQQLRPSVEEWVEDRYDGAAEIAPNSGQRFVYRTRDGRAVKLLPPLSEDDAERCRREVAFLGEAAVDGLPEVLTELQDYEIGGTQFSVYEERWLEADSVQAHVSQGDFSTVQAELVIRDGSRILADLHERKVVHRDVSPGNVLIGEGSSVAIVDLGLAKYLDLDPLTRTSEQLKMTLLFASPEQLAGGSGTLGPPTDVYSLAIVAIYAGLGEFAFIQKNEQLAPNAYLGRMAYRDLMVDISGLPDIVSEMLNPIASYRPTAEAVHSELL